MPLPRGSSRSNDSRHCALVIAVLATLVVAPPVAADGPADPPPTQNMDYQAGLDAIQVSDWERAISNLKIAAVAEPTNADLQNWLGYAYRHTGKYDEALDHYRAALDLDPAHRGAHEYVGETYLLLGNKAKAREHLAALERICGKQCTEYQDLQKAIASAK